MVVFQNQGTFSSQTFLCFIPSNIFWNCTLDPVGLTHCDLTCSLVRNQAFPIRTVIASPRLSTNVYPFLSLEVCCVTFRFSYFPLAHTIRNIADFHWAC